MSSIHNTVFRCLLLALILALSLIARERLTYEIRYRITYESQDGSTGAWSDEFYSRLNETM